MEIINITSNSYIKYNHDNSEIDIKTDKTSSTLWLWKHILSPKYNTELCCNKFCNKLANDDFNDESLCVILECHPNCGHKINKNKLFFCSSRCQEIYSCVVDKYIEKCYNYPFGYTGNFVLMNDLVGQNIQ